MSNLRDSELEFEEELGTSESAEGEGVLGTIGNVLGGLFGEEEQHESEEELHESEFGEIHELGELHEGESHELGELPELGEFGELGELHEFGEMESGEQFFGKALRRFIKRAAPILKQVARVAAPIVG